MTNASATPIPSVDAYESLRVHGRSFHFASRFLGRTHAERATRLYAFCRYVDDLADEAPDALTACNRLDTLSNDLGQSNSRDAHLIDFLDLAAATGIEAEWPLALIAGVRGDLGPVALDTEGDLIQYCYHVAGVVGLMMCAVLDVRDPKALPFAIDLGVGMQLTNIARDVGADAKLGRRYLPAEWVGYLPPQTLLNPDPAEAMRIRISVARALDLAETYYESGEAGMGYLPQSARFAILIAARVYRSIGKRIVFNNFESWRGRARVSGPRKIAIASKAAIDFSVRSALHTRNAHHDSSLHLALQGLSGSDPNSGQTV